MSEVLRTVSDLQLRGNGAAAVSLLDHEIASHPEAVQLRTLRGTVCLGLGRHRAALEDFLAVLAEQPDDVGALQGFAWGLARRPGLVFTLDSTAPLLAALACNDVDPDLLSQAGWALVHRSDTPLDDPLPLALLTQALVTDPDIEQRLVQARQDLCQRPPAQPTAMARALAIQAERNEFLWPVSATEQALLGDSPRWVQEMYGTQSPYADLADRAAAIPALTAVNGSNSQAVQGMYEDNPYPRWERFNRPTPTALGEYLHRLTEGQFHPPLALRSPRMLVAGCGTGREMLSAALAWQPHGVTGFDLSRTSLAYAQTMAERLGIDVDLYQADLTSIDSWDKQFDFIVCTGVLHHLEDPIAGWRALRRWLRPGGVMLIGLYSETARERITVAQREVAAFTPDIAGIRRARAHLMSLPADHPARGAMLLRDFYHTSGCRDLLFHVQEHQFTIPQIVAALDELGLEFLAFDIDAATREVQRTLFGSTTNLRYWDAYERLDPGTFLGMYQFWCHRPE